MRTLRRLVKDESGMTLAMAVIMIVLLGAMGAGLLTFVMTDLNTVVEENRGQRAFGVADAGIEAAKVQLASGVNRGSYDGDGPPMDVGDCGTDESGESQWSALRCEDPDGLTLTNLDDDPTTTDSVTVTIEYRGAATDDFRVISEGTYGDPPQQAKRRIEAIFAGIEDDGTGSEEVIGHPIFYTPSDILIKGSVTGAGQCNTPVKLTDVSLFSRSNILIEENTSSDSSCTLGNIPATAKTRFATDLGSPQGLMHASGPDKLCDWNSWVPANTAKCFTQANGGTGTWNTLSRQVSNSWPPGIAAEGTICKVASTSFGTCPAGAPSLARPPLSFDSTTLPRFVAKDCQLPESTSECGPEDGNLADTISYPFPLPKPIPEGLKNEACDPSEAARAAEIPPPCKAPIDEVSYFEGIPPLANSNWGLGTSNESTSKVAFIDAQNKLLTWNPQAGGNIKGIIVVWCGRMEMEKGFSGIILNLVGDGLSGNTSCDKNTPIVPPVGQPSSGKTVGTFENKGQTCTCWVYAEGGTPTLAGIQLDPNSVAQFRPSANFSFKNNLFSGPPPTQFRLQRWRELYQ